jgi:hypothetical protein
MIPKNIYEQQILEYRKFEKEPFKYDIKFKFAWFIIFDRRKNKKEWSGYEIPLHIESYWNEYDIISFSTKERLTVSEEFIDKIVNVENKKNEKFYGGC